MKNPTAPAPTAAAPAVARAPAPIDEALRATRPNFAPPNPWTLPAAFTPSPTYADAGAIIGDYLDDAARATDAGSLLLQAGGRLTALAKSLHDDLHAVRTDPALTDEGRFGRFHVHAQKSVLEAVGQLDKLRAGVVEKVDTLEQGYLARLRANNPGNVTATEVRTLLLNLPDEAARLRFIQTAADAGDTATVAAIVVSPPHLLGISRDNHAPLADRLRAQLAPAYADARERLLQGLAAFERAGVAFIAAYRPGAAELTRAQAVSERAQRGGRVGT